MKLLKIQCSVRREGSISRSLSNNFVQALQAKNSSIQHKKRDVGLEPPKHPNQLWTKANYTPPEERSPEMTDILTESEKLIAEFLWSEQILIGVPMYNFSVPSTLKAYLDNIIRINRTFTVDHIANTFGGLAQGRKALIITPSAGNFTVGTPLDKLNFCDTYLRSVLEFIGISEVTVIPVPNQFMAEDMRQKEIEIARAKLMELAMNW